MANDLSQRVRAVKELVALFRAERVTYLTVTILSLAMLLGSTTRLMLTGRLGLAEMTALFGSGGLITFSAGRLLSMFNRAARIVERSATGEDE